LHWLLAVVLGVHWGKNFLNSLALRSFLTVHLTFLWHQTCNKHAFNGIVWCLGNVLAKN